MNDLPSAQALQQSYARPKSGGDLEILGKEAASKYLRGTCGTLTDSVIETVKTAALSPEQVRRVVEFANTEAFLQEFKKEGSKHKVIEFEGGPADYPEVLRDLNDGGGGTVFDPGSGDYNMPPPQPSKVAAANLARLGYEDTKLAEAFAVPESRIPYVEPLRESLDLKDKLAGAYDEVSSTISVLEGEYIVAIDELFTQVKQAALVGTSLGEVVQAWGTVSPDGDFVKAAFSQLAPRLIDNGVFQNKAGIGDSLMKTAHAGIVNPEHPLVGSYHVFCDTLTKLAEHRQHQVELEEALDQIATFLKVAGVGVKDVAKVVRDAVGGTVRAADKHAPRVGRGAGSAAEVATRYSPHAAGVYAANETYEGAKRSPRVQKTLSYIPGTRQHQIRQYYKQRGDL